MNNIMLAGYSSSTALLGSSGGIMGGSDSTVTAEAGAGKAGRACTVGSGRSGAFW